MVWLFQAVVAVAILEKMEAAVAVAFRHEPHPHTVTVVTGTSTPPVVTADQHPTNTRAQRFNAWLAVKISGGVGTMWCAYAFGIIALISLPAAISSGSLIIIVAWVAQTFLQLVLLSIIIVGQGVQAAASDARSEATFKDAEAILHEAIELQRHLQEQDAVINAIHANSPASKFISQKVDL